MVVFDIVAQADVGIVVVVVEFLLQYLWVVLLPKIIHFLTTHIFNFDIN